MRALFSYGIALVIVLGVAAWLATGTLVIGGKGPGAGETPLIQVIEGQEDGPVAQTLEENGLLAEPEHSETAVDPHLTIAQRTEDSTGESAPPRSVRVMTVNVEPMAIEVPLRGTTRAKASVAAMPETTGTVDEVHVTKGQSVAQGDLLCTLDQGTRQAAVSQAEAGLAQAEASLSQAQADFDTNADLREKGIAAANTARPLEVALKAAEAAVTSAQSALDNAKEELNRTEVVATVAGVVQDPLASVGSMLAPGTPCATIVQLDPMLFVGEVPESRVALARLDLPATVTTVTGASVEGKVSYIAATSNPATRSFPVEIELPNADGKILSGVTASALVNLGTAPAHLLPQSVLTLDDDGVLGVRTVEDSKVAFYPIQILSDTRDGVWVSGLPATASVITIGQEFVQVGQTVKATEAGAVAEEDAADAEPDAESTEIESLVEGAHS
jgi:multidrug efflux system membrane fusion protein